MPTLLLILTLLLMRTLLLVRRAPPRASAEAQGQGGEPRVGFFPGFRQGFSSRPRPFFGLGLRV